MAKIKFVTGASCSGKSTYVKENMSENAIVFDYASLDEALTNKQVHSRDREGVNRYLQPFRRLFLTLSKEDEVNDEVWFISESITDEIQEEFKELDVEYIEMKTTLDECLERLENDDRRPDKEAWKKIIKNYFNKEKRSERVISQDREYRAFGFESNAEQEMRIEGIPIVFEQPTKMFERDGVAYYEVIDRNALVGAEMSDVVLNVNHEGKAAAKTKNGTLSIDVRNNDVFISADLSKNATGRELHESIRNGFFDKMSFAFTVAGEVYEKETRTRRITKIGRLFDVSAVDIPAYNQTSIQARSFFEVEAEKEVKELAEREERKSRMLESLKEKGVVHGN